MTQSILAATFLKHCLCVEYVKKYKEILFSVHFIAVSFATRFIGLSSVNEHEGQ
jgi:hypothetical protein